MDLKKQGDQAKVVAFFQSDPGKTEIDLLRSQLTTFRNTEIALTEARVTELARRSSTLLTIMYTLWGIIAALSIAAAIVISGNIVKTLRDVMQTISDISKGGNLKQRIQVRAHMMKWETWATKPTNYWMKYRNRIGSRTRLQALPHSYRTRPIWKDCPLVPERACHVV